MCSLTAWRTSPCIAGKRRTQRTCSRRSCEGCYPRRTNLRTPSHSGRLAHGVCTPTRARRYMLHSLCTCKSDSDLLLYTMLPHYIHGRDAYMDGGELAHDWVDACPSGYVVWVHFSVFELQRKSPWHDSNGVSSAMKTLAVHARSGWCPLHMSQPAHLHMEQCSRSVHQVSQLSNPRSPLAVEEQGRLHMEQRRHLQKGQCVGSLHQSSHAATPMSESSCGEQICACAITPSTSTLTARRSNEVIRCIEHERPRVGGLWLNHTSVHARCTTVCRRWDRSLVPRVRSLSSLCLTGSCVIKN